MPSVETVARFLDRARERLNEPFDPEGNYWKQHELLDYLNEGMREVWQTLREAHESWFLRTLRSDQKNVIIAGRAYDTTLFQMQNERNELLLPPDFRELRLIEPVQPDDPEAQPQQLIFAFAPLSSRWFRDGSGRKVHENQAHYWYDIERRATGAVLVLSQVPNLTAPRDLVLKYIAAPPKLQFASTFDVVGYEEDQLDAVLAYIIYRARQKENDPDTVAVAAQDWERKRLLALRAAGPRQSRDPEVVNGEFEDELDYV